MIQLNVIKMKIRRSLKKLGIRMKKIKFLMKKLKDNFKFYKKMIKIRISKLMKQWIIHRMKWKIRISNLQIHTLNLYFNIIEFKIIIKNFIINKIIRKYDILYAYLYLFYLQPTLPNPYVGLVLLSVRSFPTIITESADCVLELTDTSTDIKDIVEGTDVRVEINAQSEFLTDRIEEIGNRTFVMQNPDSLTEESQQRLLEAIALAENTISRIDTLLEEAESYMESIDPEDVQHQRDMMDVKEQIPECKEEYIEALRNRNNDNDNYNDTDSSSDDYSSSSSDDDNYNN